MKRFFVFIALIVQCTTSFCQIITRRNATDYIAKQQVVYSTNVKPIDIEVSNNNSEELAIGSRVYANLGLNDGNWSVINDSVAIWTMGIRIKDADFISVIFNSLSITHGDELYIYTPSNQILMGPFTERVNSKGGLYPTDLIEDSEIIMELHHNVNESFTSQLQIESFVFGNEQKGYTEDCFVDVNCPAGDNWGFQKNGTCQLLLLTSSGSDRPWASGVLINNTSTDYTPYVLTAAHCTQGSGANPNLWIFRFKHWRVGCGTSSEANDATISFSGGTFIEKWFDGTNGNDIALVKMNDSPQVSDDLYFCGWDISETTPTQSILLSHPSVGAYFMKISKSNSVSNYGKWWKSIWNIGGAMGGSSGAPLFNQHHLLIGIHHGRLGDDCTAPAIAGKLSFDANHVGESGHLITDYLDPIHSGMQILLGTSMNADLFISDTSNDNGTVSLGSAINTTDSPDIIITKTDGSSTTQIKQGEQYIVNVRVHNAGNIASNPGRNVKLYWSVVSNNMNWFSAWNGAWQYPWRPCPYRRSGLIGVQQISNPIYAGLESYVSFVWTVPYWENVFPNCIMISLNTNWACSLLAYVEDGNEIIGFDQSNYNISDFVAQNNNVARKNITALGENHEPLVAALEYVRDIDGQFPIRLQYRSKPNTSGHHLSEVAEIHLQFDENLTSIWEQSGNVPEGCSYKGNGLFIIKDTVVNFDGLAVDTSKTYFFSAYAKFHEALPAEESVMSFDINQFVLAKDDTIFGGNINFTAVYDEDAYMQVVAYEDKSALAGDGIQFTAASAASDAEYVWFNMVGDTIGIGDELNVTASTTQRYYLVGRSELDEAIGYDSVTVTVRLAAITALTPNPANNQTVVSYRLATNVTSATVVITNATGQVLYSAPLDVTQTTHTVNLQAIPTGQYSVRIESQGSPLDSKTLIVY